jgi:hypothetical protein
MLLMTTVSSPTTVGDPVGLSSLGAPLIMVWESSEASSPDVPPAGA